MNRTITVSQITELLGRALIDILARIKVHRNESIYLTGGTVRDLIMDRTPVDIDLTVRENAKGWAVEFSAITGGTLVPLGKDEDAARVVWRGRDIDFSSFREGSVIIEEELTKRDITCNSLALPLHDVLREIPGTDVSAIDIIDSSGGLADLEQGLIRATSDYSFQSDPLRLLRVFRFAATLGFSVEEKTWKMVQQQKDLIAKPAAERIAYELELIMKTGMAYRTFSQMAEVELLFEIFPELKSGVGMEQPASHHLDVFDHSMAALKHMERILEDPAYFFPADHEIMEEFIRSGRHLLQLKWAALLHDLGKPPTIAIDEDRGGRITFYNHDQVGMRLVGGIAKRLHWSREDEKNISALVGLHMRPFFLSNIERKGELTVKACLRLLKAAGTMLPGLFLLGMADAVAGQGDERPEAMEQEIATLFHHIEQVRINNMEPVRTKPPLVTGKDLIRELALEPGPVFREILNLIEEEHMENNISSREEALQLARKFVEEYEDQSNNSA